ncbi:MAG: ATP-binding protein, partial [archaeon]
MNYDVSSIEKMEGIEPIRKNPGMFVGDIRNPTRILEEVLDNALDEVQAGQCTKIFVEINNEEGYFKIIDNGRGFPFDQSRDINEDPPILSSISLFTSGKFKKGKDDAYQISTGLHGVGMSCVYALSNKMYISSCRDKLQGDYILYRDGTIKRTQTPYEGNRKYSTSITVYPSEQDFKTTQIDKSTI